ncbi:hypothetical protein ONZ51_g5809 [Trametes cubensis]|uniref:ER membrane protein complex subunit 10 n=1 Tax=Trametes cubensis TaxID=1111947 RepID=A0AAD7TUE1_9APHY|nr:hypothetical protein ONZ51_g5809 [Trametes cubensis]
MLSRLTLTPLLLLLAALSLSANAAPELRIAHRVLHPSLPAAPFVDRATILLSGSGPAATARLVPSETFTHEIVDYARSVEGLKDALYQVALEHPGDADQSQWAISSVLACHLPQSTSESFTIHLDQNGNPFSLDYFVGPIPHNGACPKKARKAAAQSSPVEFRPITNTTVALRSPSFPPLPQLRVPPPVTAEGKPVEPPREKSFLEKYWMYIAIALVAMVLAPAPAEEEAAGARGQGSGGSR